VAYNEQAWKIVKNYLPTHFRITGPCCDHCSLMYRAVVEAMMVSRADAKTDCAESYKLGYASGKAEAHADDPDMDATDFAHPAWWRGHEYSFARSCKEINDILDGTKANVGASTQPWQQLRQRLYDIRTLLGLAERVITRMPCDRNSHFYLTILQWYKVRRDYSERMKSKDKK
jgi:hypothetical protein